MLKKCLMFSLYVLLLQRRKIFLTLVLAVFFSFGSFANVSNGNSFYFSLRNFSSFSLEAQEAQSCSLQKKVYPMGLPQAQAQVLCLEQNAFVIGYSEFYKNPLWVSYRVRISPLYKNYNRYRFFSVDERTKSKVEYYDYLRSGYTRGHMAPASTIYYGFGEKEMQKTFLMSNIVPQKYSINGGVWAVIENLERDLSQKIHSEVFVISGPIFDKQKHTLQTCSKKSNRCKDTGIEIPDQFYKIIFFYNKQQKKYNVLAFFIDHQSQEKASEKSLKNFLVSVDFIERLSKINFFPLADSATENDLESSINYKAFTTFYNN